MSSKNWSLEKVCIERFKTCLTSLIYISRSILPVIFIFQDSLYSFFFFSDEDIIRVETFMLSIFTLYNQCNLDIYVIFSELVIQTLCSQWYLQLLDSMDRGPDDYNELLFS